MRPSMNNPAGPGDSPHRDRVAVALARRLGMVPVSAAQVLKGQLNYRVREIILAFNEAGDFERRNRWLAPILAALQGVAAEPLSRELILRAQLADAAEDAAESAYLSDPNPATRDEWIRKIDTALALGLAVRDALVRERQAEVA